MPTTPVLSWTETLMTSITGALLLLFGAIPKIIGFLLIVLIGWAIASAIAKIVTAVLRSVRFNELAERAGISGFIHQMGVQMDPARFVADIAKWFIRLIVLVTAFDALGLPAVSGVLQQLLLWIPNLLVAMIVLVIGGLAANALSAVVRGAVGESGLGSPTILSTVTRMLVWAFAIVIAVNQIGIATTLINTLFMAFVGALALAMGLAFGLGGRDTAAKIVSSWYERSQAASPQIAYTGQRVQEQIEEARERPAA